MSSSEISTLVGLGTFIVITITAIAAVIQLRHLRHANELDGLLSVLSRIEDMGFQSWVDEARRVIAERMPDQAFRRSVVEGTFQRGDNPWLQLAMSYEWLGSLIRQRLIPEYPVMDIYCERIVDTWETLLPVMALIRRRPDSEKIFENFEYLYVRARRFSENHPSSYPRNVARAEIRDAWAEADGLMKSEG